LSVGSEWRGRVGEGVWLLGRGDGYEGLEMGRVIECRVRVEGEGRGQGSSIRMACSMITL
jgi:hypothetical protein